MLHFSMRVHLSAGGCVKLSLQRSELFWKLAHWNELSYSETRTRVCTSQGLWAGCSFSSSHPSFSFSSLLISLDGAVSTIPLNPARCHLPLHPCCGQEWKTEFLASHFRCTHLFDNVCLISVRLYQSGSSHLINLPHGIFNYIASSQSNHTLQQAMKSLGVTLILQQE